MRDRNYINPWRWIVAISLLSLGSSVLAMPVPSPNSVTGVGQEDFGTATKVLKLSSIYSENNPPNTITYSLAGTSGTPVATASVDPVSGFIDLTSIADANGTETFTFLGTDSDGSAPFTFTLTLNPVNDAPSFASGGDQTLAEDAGAVAISGWATGISPGAANESSQVLAFTILSNDNPGLFSAPPAVDPSTGDLTFTPAADASGTARITLDLVDDAGTSNGGGDTSTPVSFTIDVTPVNDAPTFTPGGDVTVAEDAGPQTVSWASNVSAGPPDESGQVLTFSVVNVADPSLFSVQPTLDAAGKLSFTPALNAFGSTSITVRLSDDGGTANGGIDTAADQAFQIVLDSQDDPAVANPDEVTMNEDGGSITIAVLDNDVFADPPGTLISAGTDGYSDGAPLVILDPQGDPIVGGDGNVVPNGTVSVSGNTVIYEPKANFSGDDQFTYTVRDANGSTATATVTVHVLQVNDPPVGKQEITYVMQEGGSLTVDAANSLVKDAYDIEDQTVDPVTGQPPNNVSFSAQLVTSPSVPTLAFAPDGTFVYTPPPNFLGDVTFEYRISDGNMLSVGDAYRVRIVVLAAPEPPAPPPPGEVAIPFNLSNVPLEQSTSVPPNVLVVMDDSGSMDWNLVVSGAGQDGGFEIDNSDYVSRRGRYSTSFTYLWDLRNNAYPPTSGNGYIVPTEEALAAHGASKGWGANNYGVWRARNHLYNRLYYNPEVEYTPWVGEDASNAEFGNADPSAIRLDPRDPTNLFDMLSPHDYRSSRVPEWDSNGGTDTVDVNGLYIPRYYTTTGTVPLAWDAPHALVEIKPGNEPFPGGADREDCAVDDGDPMTCTYQQEIQNFANYFQYYRSREYVTKNGIGKVVSQVQDVRVGYETISNTTSEPIRNMNTLHTEGDKKALLDNIYSVDSYGGTPLRQALVRAGKTFACQTGNDCPALPAPEGTCQQNFALLFSDGYWNGGTGVSGNSDGDGDTDFDGGRYADNVKATLADVAMYYYENDIQPTLDDQVPVMSRDVEGAPDGTFPDINARMHQNMKTYTIAFGVAGTVDPADIPSDPQTPFSWPNPFSGNQQKIDDMLHTAVNGRGRFLNASSPQQLQAAFEAAFLEFTQAASSTSSAAFNSTSLREDTLLYRGFYDLRDNTGELTATSVDPSTGELATSPTWRASDQLEASVISPGNRRIVTYDPVNHTGIPFEYASLTADQQLTLNQSQVNYLRGARDDEQPAGNLRQRPASNGSAGRHRQLESGVRRRAALHQPRSGAVPDERSVFRFRGQCWRPDTCGVRWRQRRHAARLRRSGRQRTLRLRAEQDHRRQSGLSQLAGQLHLAVLPAPLLRGPDSPDQRRLHARVLDGSVQVLEHRAGGRARCRRQRLFCPERHGSVEVHGRPGGVDGAVGVHGRRRYLSGGRERATARRVRGRHHRSHRQAGERSGLLDVAARPRHEQRRLARQGLGGHLRQRPELHVRYRQALRAVHGQRARRMESG